VIVQISSLEPNFGADGQVLPAVQESRTDFLVALGCHRAEAR
jgi:hypothetical protein